jgi:hypothetical protein
MAATNFVLYAGSTFDLSYGGSGFSWAKAPNPADIGDASNVPNDPTFGLWNPSFATPRTVYAEYKLALGLTGIVSIASVQLYAWCMATGTAGTFDTDVSAMVRPNSAGSGSGGDYYSAPIVLTSHSSALETFGELVFAPWTVNPSTSLPWTLSDLAALAFGLRFVAPASSPVNNPSIKLGRLRMVVDATSTPGDTAQVRTVGSTLLRQFGRPLEVLKLTLPAICADIGIGESFFTEHVRGRRSDGPGWGRKPLERGWHRLAEKSIDPITGDVSIVGHGQRRPAARLWVPGLTTVGHSLDGQGLPVLHSGGGGPTCVRAGPKWVDRAIYPVDNVMQGVTDNLLAHDYRGMAVEAGGDTNIVLNSTFSQGSGNTFTDWTASVSGTGTVTEDTARIGVDEVGLRRAAFVQVGITDASIAIIGQGVTVAGDFRIGIRTYNDYGAGKLGAVFQRASDSFFRKASDGSWGASFGPDQISRIGNDVTGGYSEWVQSIAPGGADTVTVKIGYFGEAGSVLDGIGYRAYVWSVDVVEGTDHIGTPIITTSAPIARISDFCPIPNDDAVRWWSFERGFSWTLGFIPLWDAADLANGQTRTLLYIPHGNSTTIGPTTTSGGYSQICYRKGDGFVFEVYAWGVTTSAIYPVDTIPGSIPVRGRKVKLSGYYVGPDGELGRSVGEIGIAVNDDYVGPSPTVRAVRPVIEMRPILNPTSTGYLGHVTDPFLVASDWANGFIRQVDVSPVVLDLAEQQRKPS